MGWDIIRTAAKLAVMLAVVAGIFQLGRLCGRAERAPAVEASPTLPTIREVQQLIGCDAIDGQLGPETQKRWDEYLANRYAAVYMTATGAPNKMGQRP